jgi:hypothetical protein
MQDLSKQLDAAMFKIYQRALCLAPSPRGGSSGGIKARRRQLSLEAPGAAQRPPGRDRYMIPLPSRQRGHVVSGLQEPYDDLLMYEWSQRILQLHLVHLRHMP